MSKKAMQWIPIETAPKDGTVIIIGNENGIDLASWVVDEGEILVSEHPTPYWEPYNHSMWLRRYLTDIELLKPTHWMPLPLPPENKSDESPEGKAASEGERK